MSLQNVKEYLKKYNMDSKIIELNESSATVELAAKALNCEPERIAKSMAFINGDDTILVVTAGDAKIDNQKFKEYFKAKASMIPYQEVGEYIGHDAGGVCPFAIKDNVKVYLDVSLKRFKTVFPACGSSNTAIELTTQELEKYSNYIDWIDVCKNWELKKD